MDLWLYAAVMDKLPNMAYAVTGVPTLHART